MLSDLPEIVLKSIVEKCGFRSIFALRKVSHTFRNFIDDIQPCTGIKYIDIVVDFNVITVRISTNSISPECYHIKYGNIGQACSVTTRSFPSNKEIPLALFGPLPVPGIKKSKERILEGRDFVESLFEDLKAILNLQTSTLQQFNIRLDCLRENMFETRGLTRSREISRILPATGTNENIVYRVLNDLELIIRNRKTHLKVENFTMNAVNHTQVLQMLSCLDPKNLKSVNVHNARPHKKDGFETREITQLEQWRHAEQLHMNSFNVSTPIQSIYHFRKASISLETICCDDLNKLKETFLGSSKFERCKVQYNTFQDKEKLINIFGSAESGQEWFFWEFSIPDSKEDALFLNVVLCYPHTICFTRCSKLDPPQKGCVNCVYV